MKSFRLIVVWVIILVSCRNSPNSGIVQETTSSDLVQFAQGFDLSMKSGSMTLTVRNPWQNATGIEYNYILSDTIDGSFQVNDFTWMIKTPVKRVICLSTTHIGLLSSIGQTETVCGVSGGQYVVNERVRNQIRKGNIADIGYDEGLNYELIVKLDPDVVFAYGVSVSVTNSIRKLNELGIPVVLIGEYLESDPLGKTEWIKAVAAFYNTYELSSEKFDTIATRYNHLSHVTSGVKYRPEVVLGLPWQGNWYVSGARSYIARLIKDAGGNYIWRDLDFNESRPIGLEKIYEKALSADFWINPGEARSMNEIVAIDPRFGNLPPVINSKIYNNDNKMSATGGNDFFETGVVEPDVILYDLISILHPHLLPSHKLKYYRKVN